MADQYKVTYIKSAIGRSYKQKRVIRALGFTRLHQSRVIEANPSMMGMVNKVYHLVRIEPVNLSVSPSDDSELNADNVDDTSQTVEDESKSSETVEDTESQPLHGEETASDPGAADAGEDVVEESNQDKPSSTGTEAEETDADEVGEEQF